MKTKLFKISWDEKHHINDSYLVPLFRAVLMAVYGESFVCDVEEINKLIDKAMPCNCIDDYTRRGLVAPDCPNHNYKDDIARAISDLPVKLTLDAGRLAELLGEVYTYRENSQKVLDVVLLSGIVKLLKSKAEELICKEK